MSTKSISKRHKMLALAGVALLTIPLLFSPQAGGASATAPVVAPQSVGFNPAQSYAAIVAADKPAVVTVTTKARPFADRKGDGGNGAPNFPMDEFFRQFFGENGPFAMPMRPMPRNDRGPVREAIGSGFVVNGKGIIVTNNHVIDGADEINVTLDDGTNYPAALVGRDTKTDIAVLRVKADSPLPTVTWGDSDKLQVGDPVLAIGNPFGIGTTVTSGIVSARGRDLHNGPYDDFIQVDAAINRGNSGGPLVDVYGHVVGINSAIYSPNGGNVGVGFAIPSDQAQSVISQLVANGSIEHGYIGVQIQPVTKDIADAIGLDQAAGALVASVADGSPAAKAGFKVGDIIRSVNGAATDSPKDVSRRVADLRPGKHADVSVWRDDKSVDLSVTIGRNSKSDDIASTEDNGMDDVQPDVSDVAVPSLGLDLSNLTQQERQYYDIPDDEHGVLVRGVKQDRSADQHGIQEGDVIVSVNQSAVGSAGDALDAIDKVKNSGRKSVLLQIERDGETSFVALPFDRA